MEFWMVVEDLKSLKETFEITQMANEIFHTFVGFDAPSQVNIPSVIYNDISNKILRNEIDVHMYDRAQWEIYRLLERDNFHRFLCTPQGRMLRLRHQSRNGVILQGMCSYTYMFLSHVYIYIGHLYKRCRERHAWSRLLPHRVWRQRLVVIGLYSLIYYKDDGPKNSSSENSRTNSIHAVGNLSDSDGEDKPNSRSPTPTSKGQDPNRKISLFDRLFHRSGDGANPSEPSPTHSFPRRGTNISEPSPSNPFPRRGTNLSPRHDSVMSDMPGATSFSYNRSSSIKGTGNRSIGSIDEEYSLLGEIIFDENTTVNDLSTSAQSGPYPHQFMISTGDNHQLIVAAEDMKTKLEWMEVLSTIINIHSDIQKMASALTQDQNKMYVLATIHVFMLKSN